MSFLWWDGESCRIGAFLQPEIYPPSKPLGEDTPRCGFYIRPEDVDKHLGRLDRHRIPHTDPVQAAGDGDQGTVIYFADGCTRAEFGHPSVDRPGVPVGSRIESDLTPIAWPRPEGDLPPAPPAPEPAIAGWPGWRGRRGSSTQR